MTEGETLKACPFCGGEAEMQPWHGGGPDKQLIGCSDPDGLCIARPSVTGETPAEAIAAWNTRPAPDSGDRNAVLVQLLEALACDCDAGENNAWEEHEWQDSAALLRRAAAALSTPEPMPDDRDAEIERLKADIATLQDANFRQANCIHLTAQALGPDRSATIEGLPKAAAHLREALERIATVDMGGGFLAAKACRDLANKTLTAWKEARDATN